ncbi:hypothetical protein OGATHE_004428 [Ogataea polymorpha]|uniref:Uncharacterized protein n=1 Tax=Ogataea polymorpha TaxID=460523 RepID=A0A9P8P098_9ASCO|nr:hypothetical protein OGATHE_004428 [Ogataea polymorpha]
MASSDWPSLADICERSDLVTKIERGTVGLDRAHGQHGQVALREQLKQVGFAARFRPRDDKHGPRGIENAFAVEQHRRDQEHGQRQQQRNNKFLIIGRGHFKHVHVFLGDRHVVRKDEDDRNKHGPHTGVEHDWLGELAQVEWSRRHTHLFRVDHEEENHQHVRPISGDGADGENGVHGDRGAEVDQGQKRVDDGDHPQTSERHTGGLVDVVPERRERNATVSGERPERSADGADGDSAAEPEHNEAQGQVRGGSLSAHGIVEDLDDWLTGRGVEDCVEVVTHAQRVDDVEDPAKERGHGECRRNGERRGVRGVANLLRHSGGGVHGDDEGNDGADIDETVVFGDSGEDGGWQRVDETVRDDHGDRRAGYVASCRHVLVVGSHGNRLQQQRCSSEIGRARSGHGSDEVQPPIDPADKRHVFLGHDVGNHIVHSTTGWET